MKNEEVVKKKDTPYLKERYKRHVIPAMMKKFHYKNPLQVPGLQKIVINRGIGEGGEDSRALESAQEELSLISGQHSVLTRARKSISSFKIRKGTPIGCMVTLRGDRMLEFLERLIHIALPRIRDFRGVSGNSFDGKGNYTLGIKEQNIFPEINYEKIYKVRGMDITIVTSAKTNEEARQLLELLGMPFRKK